MCYIQMSKDKGFPDFSLGNNAREKTGVSLNTEEKKNSCLRTLYSVKMFSKNKSEIKMFEPLEMVNIGKYIGCFLLILPFKNNYLTEDN